MGDEDQDEDQLALHDVVTRKRLKDLGRRVASARKLHGLDQEPAAVLASISIGAYGQLERGVGNPTFKLLWQVADAFQVSVLTLLEPLDDE